MFNGLSKPHNRSKIGLQGKEEPNQGTQTGKETEMKDSEDQTASNRTHYINARGEVVEKALNPRMNGFEAWKAERSNKAEDNKRFMADWERARRSGDIATQLTSLMNIDWKVAPTVRTAETATEVDAYRTAAGAARDFEAFYASGNRSFQYAVEMYLTRYSRDNMRKDFA
jgi:hypothetical protein